MLLVAYEPEGFPVERLIHLTCTTDIQYKVCHELHGLEADGVIDWAAL
jgi:hypothetical protein